MASREELNTYRAKMRAKPTKAERALLRALEEQGVRFEFQEIIGPYIVDFLLLDTNRVIELDGSNHYHEDQIDYDNRRTEYLKRAGYKVIRFDNKQVFNQMPHVLKVALGSKEQKARKRKVKKRKRANYKEALKELERQGLVIRDRKGGI